MIIARDGYDSRSYVVVTEDGYLLHMDRILPRGPGKHHPVLLQHGLLSSSADWLTSGRDRALRNVSKT
jgi:lysosomal acid lipase/cholesteryl ester hydrolase